jgi:hypothetical protein
VVSGRVEPDLGLALVLEACKGVEEQQGLVRGPPAALGELADAVEPGEQGLAVEGCRGRCPIEGWFRHRAKIERLRTRRKGTHQVGTNQLEWAPDRKIRSAPGRRPGRCRPRLGGWTPFRPG